MLPCPAKRGEIKASCGTHKWVIVLDGTGTTVSDPGHFFIAVLGEVIQRIENQNNKYSIALPDTVPYQRLWKRLPQLAKKRLGITALFVNSSGMVREEFTWR
jgi:hypothetical protein